MNSNSIRSSGLKPSTAATDSSQCISSSSALTGSFAGSASRTRFASFGSARGWSGLPPPKSFIVGCLRKACMILRSQVFINASSPGTIGAVLARPPMRFLIVDDSSESRQSLAAMLRTRWPDALIDEWNPRQHGQPSQALARGRYSAVLLDARPAGEDGLRWIAQIRNLPQAPPAVLVADQGDTHTAIQAMKTGAADFLRRVDLTPERLARALEDAMREHEVRRQESTGTHSPFSRTMPLDLQRIGAPVRRDALSIPGYRTLRMIGEGGMAQVYLAERVRDGMQLVLKVL